MPATAGRVRMPHNNRMHSSAALKMTGIWKNTIGYDPYAAEDEKQEATETSYEQSKGLMTLAKLSNKGSDIRGACKKCGKVGHLTFQCRNHLDVAQKAELSLSSDDSSSEENDDSEDDSENEKQLSSRCPSSRGRSRSRSAKRRCRKRSVSRSRSTGRRRRERSLSRSRVPHRAHSRSSSAVDAEKGDHKRPHSDLLVSTKDKKRKTLSKKHKKVKKDRKHHYRHHCEYDSKKLDSKK